MIIEFKVSNFRSINKEVKLSMIAKKGNEFPENVKIHKGFDKPLLNTVAIYGSNGSGKSNILKAIQALSRMVVSAKTGDDVVGSYFRQYEPFRFGQTIKGEPTCIEIDYLAEDKRYVYVLCFNKTNILNEQLFTYKESKKVNIFNRKHQIATSKDVYSWGSILSDEEKNSLIKITEWASGKTFLQAIGREENKILNFIRPAYEWFRLMVLFDARDNRGYGKHATIELLEDEELGLRDKIIEVIKNADMSIYDCRIEGKDEKKVTFIYKVDEEFYELPYEEESLGTKRFFEMAGLLILIEKLGKIAPIIFDEIETSLHPELVACLLKKIHGQVIFTTHDSCMMDKLRRDQIWLTDKNKDSLSTDLYSLADFNGIRKDAIKRNVYKKGILGAYPFISFTEDDGEGENE